MTETAFHAGLLDPTAPPPHNLMDGQGRAAGKRYDVYRNNVMHGLQSALRTGFPAIARLVGDHFTPLARSFARETPPDSPMMMLYGARFPVFLETYQPLAHLGYLPDVARLEYGLRRSYHAADRTPLDPAALADLTEDQLLDAYVSLAPSVQLIASPWPILQVYDFALRPGSPKPQAIGQDVLITRPAFDPEPHALPPGSAAFIRALQSDLPLGAAIDAGQSQAEDFDPASLLTRLLSRNALTDLTTRDARP